MELNDDLDDIFKRLNDENNFDETWEGAWEKMEIKLDKGYKKYPAGFSTLKKFGIGVGILSSIIIGIIYFTKITQKINLSNNSNLEQTINKNDLNHIENQKNGLKLKEIDKKNQNIIVDSNTYLPNSVESKTEKLVTNSTKNTNKKNVNLGNLEHSNLASKSNLESKNKSNQNPIQSQKSVYSNPKLSQINNYKNNYTPKPKKELNKNNLLPSANRTSEFNKPNLLDLDSKSKDLLTNETKSKNGYDKIAKSENTLDGDFEKKSKINTSEINEYETTEFKRLSNSKTDNTKSELIRIKREDQNIEKAIKIDFFEVNYLKKLNKVNFLADFIFKNNPSDYTIPKLDKPSETKPNYTPTKGIALRLGYSPDISLIKGHSAEKIGNNFNALIEWRINSKWALNTGVIKSLKYYDAYPEEYNWPANWKKPPNPLLEINATCNMLDIPINIRYDFKSYRNGLFFIKSGLTSYVMLKEKYIYDYEDNNDPLIKWKKWEGSTGNYKLGVINISTGIELRYRKNIFVQIEPFAKIPIKEIGFGKVMLSTYGVFVSTKIPLINFK